jgi:Calcineurin-like phosphoesterase
MRFRAWMVRVAAVLLIGAACATSNAQHAPASTRNAGEWTFAVSGDSRNCGDLVMPTIAQDAARHSPAFYWHLGDFRALYKFDEDILGQIDGKTGKPRGTMNITDYDRMAWDDFIQHQVAPFEQARIPVFLGIGNHETVPPKTRADYIAQFGDWIDTPMIQEQRLADNPRDHRLRTYYRWKKNGVDFITLDNASDDQFDREQVAWFKSVVARDEADATVHAIVVGMHKALPNSRSCSHSMSESAQGAKSGEEVYEALLTAQNQGHKHVYILASHSHFFMEDIYNTPYWQSHGGVLPGWIVGTAGAVRYRLPPGATAGAKTDVYGYLLGTVKPDGEISFAFQELGQHQLPRRAAEGFTPETVNFCFSQNKDTRPMPDQCPQ